MVVQVERLEAAEERFERSDSVRLDWEMGVSFWVGDGGIGLGACLVLLVFVVFFGEGGVVGADVAAEEGEGVG